MFHHIIKTYADAVTVATTLRLPPSARDVDASAAGGESARPPLSSRLVGRVIRWLGCAADGGLPAAAARAVIRTPQA
jgi:hypothetical protein